MPNIQTRAEVLRLLVLRNIADDYENLVVSIEMPLMEQGGRCGLFIERSEIVRALSELVELGWAKAYRLGPASAEIQGVPSLEEMEDFDGAWFYITETGLNVLRANWEAQPLDDEGEQPREGWTLPDS